MHDERYVHVRQRAEAYEAWYEKEHVCAHIAGNCREEAEKILAQADRLMAHTFSFEDRWDMEPCREPFTLKEMIWDRSPNGDPEWIFMLNRHEYMNKLLIAGWLTGDTSYAEKLKWFLLHWIQANPILPEGTVTTRTIDTGIRCMSWQYLLLHLLGEGLIEEREAGEILESMKDQFASLRKRYIGKYTLSNWGVLQTASICSGYLWFREYLPSDGTEDWAWKELERQMGLQVLDDGHITDAHGRKVDFKQTIIIMTSNAGAQAIIEQKKLGFMSGDNEKQDYERMKSNVMEEVRRLFKPEFLNRIDEIMVFHTLNKEHIRKIVGLLLKNLEKRCEEQMDIRLKISDSARAYLAEAGFDSKYGARPLRRAIQTKLEDSLANEILEGRIRKGDTVKVQLHQKQLRFIPVPAEKADKK